MYYICVYVYIYKYIPMNYKILWEIYEMPLIGRRVTVTSNIVYFHYFKAVKHPT